MNITAYFPNLNSIQLLTEENKQKAIVYIKSASAITVIAAATFSAMAFSYYAAGYWTLVTLGASITQIYSLSKLLEHGNHPLGRTALIVSLLFTGSLITGGSITATNFFMRSLCSSIATYNVGSILIHSFLFTGTVGYAVPLSQNFLKKTYSILTDSSWKEKLQDIAYKLQRIPEPTYTATVSIKSFIYKIGNLISFIDPQYFLNFTRSAGIEVDFRHFILNTYAQKISDFESLNMTLKSICQFHERNTPLTAEHKKILYQQLKFNLERLNTEELNIAIELIQKQMSILIPNILSIENFNTLLEGKLGYAIQNRSLEWLSNLLNLSNVDHTCDTDLFPALQRIEQDRQRGNPKEELQERLNVIKQKFLIEKQKIEKLYGEKKYWANTLNILPPYLALLKQKIPLLDGISHDLRHPQLMNSLTEHYQGALGVHPNAVHHLGGVLNQIQRLSNLLADNQDEQTSAWEFLGTNRCGFIVADYEELREWLQAPTLQEIEDKLHEIELRTEEDLYNHAILPRTGIISKRQIKENLKAYIHNQRAARRDDIRARIYRNLASLKQFSPSLHILSQNISKLIYRLATIGMILTPVLLHPVSSAIGFGLGTCYFTLQRFGSRYIEKIKNWISNLEYVSDINLTTQLIAGRNLLSLTPSARNNMETFSQSDLFAKMRILNLELLVTIGITIHREPYETLGLGGFLQGTALSREANNLILIRR